MGVKLEHYDSHPIISNKYVQEVLRLVHDPSIMATDCWILWLKRYRS